jgi:hypothetical protein
MRHFMSKNSYVTVVYPKTIPVNGGAENCFLAGPIRNAPSWHEDAIDMLARMVREDRKRILLRINCPKRFQHIERIFDEDPQPLLVHKKFDRQTDWEIETQESAARSAGVLFWLPAPGKILHPGKVYGTITQMEIAKWFTRASVDRSLRIAFGTDGVYNNELRTILRHIEHDAPWLVPMHTSLESLCAQSIRWAKQGSF